MPRRISCASPTSASRWPGRGAFTLAVDDFALPARERLLLIGPSGQRQVDVPQPAVRDPGAAAGPIEVLGTDIDASSARSARDGFRAEHFGIIFQMFNLLPYGSVIDNVLLPLELRAGRGASAPRRSGAAEDEAARLLDRLGLDAPSWPGARRRT